MKKRNQIITWILCVTMAISPASSVMGAVNATPVQNEQSNGQIMTENGADARAAALTDGWLEDTATEGTVVWSYIEDGNALYTWTFANDKWTCSGTSQPEKKSGYVVIGIDKADGNKEVHYFLDEEGTPLTGWQKDGDAFLKFGDDGKQVTTEAGYYGDINGKEYYLESDGTPKTDQWIDQDGKKMYFGITGAREDKSGLQNINGKEYYLNDDGTPIKNQWKDLDGSKVYFGESGARESKSGLVTIDGVMYFLNSDGTPVKNQWKDLDGSKLYFGESGARESRTGLVTIDGAKYFLNSDGTPITDTWQVVDGRKYYFGSDGKCTKEYTLFKEGWIRNGSGWWYQNEDGTWPANSWKMIDGTYYAFDGNGYMRTGWFRDGSWYYLRSSGAMASGWVNDGGTWYFMNSGGAMQTGWYQEGNIWYYSNGSGAMQTGWLRDGSWYYLSGSGAMITGWLIDGGTWYFLNGNGTMRTGWYQEGNTWYYSSGSGAMKTGWIWDGSWYYLKESGAMATGWANVGGTWYYLANGGAMLTGWFKDGSTWYYLDGSGAMAVNRWVGNYFLAGSGAMAVNAWVNGFYVGSDGAWIPGYGTVSANTQGNWEKWPEGWYFKNIDGGYAADKWIASGGNWYYVKSNGLMVTGWNTVGSYQYYFNDGGAMSQDLRSMVGGPYDIEVNRAKCCITVYKKNTNIPVVSFVTSVGMPNTPTPTGVFYTDRIHRWKELMGPSWGQYATHVVAGIYFHSVAGSAPNPYALPAGEYNRLGAPASHGCIRMTVADAKWIYDNCGLGTKVTIYDDYSSPGPFDKPIPQRIPGEQNWDPTDPAV